MAGTASDIATGNWVDRWLPVGLRPYARLARLDRPVGIWLLMLPCWWGVALAARGWPDARLLALFAAGAAVMRAAGCVLNDIIDRDIDRQVARTAGRPIASGAISLSAATLFMLGLALIGLVILLQLNTPTLLLGIVSLLLVAVYPFMKRVTYWPQAFLGLTFNWGALMGWTAVTGALAPAAVALYIAGILWTLGYDTIYAHQDKEDDIRVGVKSTALRLGADTRPWLLAFYGGMIAMLLAAAVLAGLPLLLFAICLAPAIVHLAWQARIVDLNRPESCLRVFKANTVSGILVFLAISLTQILARG